MILDLKKMDPDVLVHRTKHIGTMQNLISRCKKYEYVNPVYYGIFFGYDNILKILEITGINYEPVQRTPLHVTMFFGKEIFSEECKSISIGRECPVKVVSFCKSEAGVFLNVEVSTISDYYTKGYHITLETYSGYKPADLGKFPIVSTIPIDIETTGIFGPIY